VRQSAERVAKCISDPHSIDQSATDIPPSIMIIWPVM
jgi:hypothetical protein